MSKVIKSNITYHGMFIKIRHDYVEIDGKTFTREIVESKQGVLIAVINRNGKIVLIKQHRHNLGDVYEVPSGAIKEKEPPLDAAKRELLEETGLIAKKWKLLSTHHNGVHNEGLNYFFLAQNISVHRKSLDQDEEIYSLSYFSFEKANDLMSQTLIPDLRSRACIWRAQIELSKI